MAPAVLKPVGGMLEYYAGPVGVGHSLNPYLRFDPWNEAANAFGRAYLGGVSVINTDTGEVEADLLVDLPSVANGGLKVNNDGSVTVRYEIDPAAVWSDGTAISGDDFAFTYEIVTATAERVERAWQDDTNDDEFYESCGDTGPVGVFGADAFAAIDPGSIESGPKTFEFTLADPQSYDLGLFRYIVPKHAVEGTDFLKDWNDAMWPSAGPFMLESHDLVTGVVTMVRNENYWRVDPETGQRLPYLDGIVLSPLDDGFAAREDTDVGEFRRALIECRFIGPSFGRVGIEPGTPEAGEMIGRIVQAVDDIEPALFADGRIYDQRKIPTEEGADELRDAGVEFRVLRGNFFEHITFHYGDARLRANPASLVEHLQFRRAIAHALDRDRIAAEASFTPLDPIRSMVEAFSASLSGQGWDRYEYDPEEARRLIAGLCDSLGRDCESEPPSLVFTETVGPFGTDRATIAGLVDEMLGEVGIEVDIVEADIDLMLGFSDCSGWESSTWTLGNFEALQPLPSMFNVLDPATTGGSADLGRNPYAWGTDAVDDITGQDDPLTECDENTVLNQGPSAIRDEFTDRFEELLRAVEQEVDIAGYGPLVLEMEDILADQVVVIPLFNVPLSWAFRTDIVGGIDYQAQIGDFPAIFDIDRWYLVDG